MKCMSPNLIYFNEKTGKYSFSKPDKFYGDKCLFVPCGKCPACKAEWRTQLAQRVRWELEKYNYNERCFLTLTVDNEHIDEVFPDGSLNHAYFQKFMKNLRRQLEYHNIPHKPLKYVVSGEYGEKNGRPHFHLILFGWKPTDLKFRGRSQKGYNAYKSSFLEEVWKAGFVDVGDVSEHTAPYMVKYIVKFAEVKRREIIDYEYIDVEERKYNKFTGEWFDSVRSVKTPIYREFTVNGVPVRKPYIVYPKKILGIDFFLENYKQILRNGYILDSKGNKHGIPRSFKKFCENTDNLDILEEYNYYLLRNQIFIDEENEYLNSLGYLGYMQKFRYYREQGQTRREMYEAFKNKNR